VVRCAPDPTRLHETRGDLLCALVERHCAQTGAHLERVASLSAALAATLSLSSEQVWLVAQAGRLHDVGKIGVPRSLLRKRAALTAPERRQVERHCEIGYALLSDGRSPELELAARVALCHHERWDGSGYPNALLGEEIPLEARLVAVADAFDALSTPRPYRPALTPAEALELIGRRAGSQFDPEAVRALRALTLRWSASAGARAVRHMRLPRRRDARRRRSSSASSED
jgi:HD-GYP domain-containing protein (c-di-GMP phosphodiesterase class II)